MRKKISAKSRTFYTQESNDCLLLAVSKNANFLLFLVSCIGDEVLPFSFPRGILSASFPGGIFSAREHVRSDYLPQL